MKNIIIVFLLFFVLLINAQDRFVSVSGSGSHNGTSQTNEWTFDEANSNDVAGMILNVRAGNYGNIRKTIATSGTSSSPIIWRAYKTTPGDIVTNNAPTRDYPQDVDSIEMPLFQGSRTNSIGSGTGLKITGSYVELYNFQFKHYDIGIESSGAFNVLGNIISIENGDFDPAHSFPTGTPSPSLNYHGRGIIFGSTNGTLKNSYILNAGAEGVRVNGSYQLHLNNKVYSDQNINPTDYYYVGTGGFPIEHNVLDNLYIERVGDLEHNGHGITLKLNARYNTIKNCEVKNTNFELQFSSCQYNVVENCISSEGIGNGGGFSFANGANLNTISNHTFAKTGLSYWANGEDDAGEIAEAGFKNRGHGNRIINCKFIGDKGGGGAKFAISFGYYRFQEIDNPNYNNYYEGCTFYNYEYLFKVDSNNYGNTFTNCVIDNVDFLEGETFLDGLTYPVPLVGMFSHTNFSNGFAAPSGTSITTHQPLFVDAANSDFRLQSVSFLRGIGLVTNDLNTVDFDGKIRGLTYDIGAYEYDGSTPPPVTPTNQDKIFGFINNF